MNFNKMLYAFFISMLITGISSLPAFAWQVNMSDVDGTLTVGEAYTVSVDFEGDASDMLDMVAFAIEWDTSLVEIADFPELAEYTRGTGFDEYVLWGGSPIGSIPNINHGRWYDIAGETDLDHMHEFFPVATGETHIATLTFNALQTGIFEDVVSFYFTPEDDLTELVDINYETFIAQQGELMIYKEGSTSVMAPVPVPAAVWMLGSGLLGLIGLRRRAK